MRWFAVPAVLIVVVMTAGCASTEQTQTVAATTPPETASSTQAAPTTATAAPPARCDQNISVSRASCSFANNVFRAYVTAIDAEPNGPHDHAVEAASAITGKTFSMECHVAGAGSITTCSGSPGKVTFPLLAAQVYKQPALKTPSRPATPESPTPESTPPPEEPTEPKPEEPKEEGTPDEVGSASHATDAEFCAEAGHTCIGSFETEQGTIVECNDGTYSHAGGIQGACSHHNGESTEE